MKKKKKDKKRKTYAGRIIALGFLGIILAGALLLMLPISSRSGEGKDFLTAVFTATSATCVTGLSLGDTWTMWSGFGQAVILVLIQIGGLGFMSVLSLLVYAFRKEMNMYSQFVLAESIGVDNMSDLGRIRRRVIFGGLIIEGVGALILTVRFLFRYDFLTSLKLGVFHSISAFCNAGFDILGFEEPGQSLIPYGTDFVVCVTVALLIILGGLGFVVWDEVLRVRSPKKWSVYTKLVLITSSALILTGWAFFCVTEWNNPDTIGNMTVGQKLLAAFFQSVTTRTAGFAGVDQGALTESGKAGTLFFMLIGGSSGSTAGGLKTVTFVVLVLFMWSKLRGKESVNVFHRTVPDAKVLDAVMLFGIMISLTFAGAAVVCMTSPVALTDAMYETVSALATVGLSTGITAQLSTVAKIMMIVFMFFGRVGILTISLGFLRPKPQTQEYQYATAQFLIG